MKEKESEEKIVDLKGTIEGFVEEEQPELSQEDAIKSYRADDTIKVPKKKKNTEDEEENEDDEHLKRVKKELLASLERVKTLSKQLFDEKERVNLKDLKVKSGSQKSKNREQVMEQMRQRVQEEKERSRGE